MTTENYNLLKIGFKIGFQTIVTFCIISYCSVMWSLMASIGDLETKPVANIGFPYKYYYQFWLRGNDSPNCGWRIGSFWLDLGLVFLLVIAIQLILQRFKTVLSVKFFRVRQITDNQQFMNFKENLSNKIHFLIQNFIWFLDFKNIEIR